MGFKDNIPARDQSDAWHGAQMLRVTSSCVYVLFKLVAVLLVKLNGIFYVKLRGSVHLRFVPMLNSKQ